MKVYGYEISFLAFADETIKVLNDAGAVGRGNIMIKPYQSTRKSMMKKRMRKAVTKKADGR